MRLTTKTTGSVRPHAKSLTMGLAIVITALSTSGAAAHIIPWWDGMSRTAGFGQCAKGPCMKRYDFGPSVRHAHMEIDGRNRIVMCTGLGRQHPACPSPWHGDRR